MARKDFKSHNEGFICARCKHKNPPAPVSMRNHCRKCLCSLHVDEETPGDRASTCGGVMEPERLDYKGSKGFMILHHCIKCRKEILNRAAPDDEIQKL